MVPNHAYTHKLYWAHLVAHMQSCMYCCCTNTHVQTHMVLLYSLISLYWNWNWGTCMVMGLVIAIVTILTCSAMSVPIIPSISKSELNYLCTCLIELHQLSMLLTRYLKLDWIIATWNPCHSFLPISLWFILRTNIQYDCIHAFTVNKFNCMYQYSWYNYYYDWPNTWIHACRKELAKLWFSIAKIKGFLGYQI